MNLVIDAGVILKAYFPDEECHIEAQRLIKDYAEGSIELQAPYLIIYEMINAVSVAKRRGRLAAHVAQEIIAEICDIEIGLHKVDDAVRLLDLSLSYGRSVYDASYIVLSETLDTRLITADQRFFDSVCGGFHRIFWIGEYGKTAV